MLVVFLDDYWIQDNTIWESLQLMVALSWYFKSRFNLDINSDAKSAVHSSSHGIVCDLFGTTRDFKHNKFTLMLLSLSADLMYTIRLYWGISEYVQLNVTLTLFADYVSFFCDIVQRC